jgi:hydroxymethylbilane synthase
MLKIGTWGSESTNWQATLTQAALRNIGVESELILISAQEKDLTADKGLFTKALADALLRGEVDVAIHNLTDLSTEQPEGLCITAVSGRGNPADWLVIRKDAVQAGKIFQLKTGAIVGISAAHQKIQLQDYRPDTDIRDDQPVHLENLRQGVYDAIFVEAALMDNLNIDLTDFQVITLHPHEFVPAPAQGVFAWQTNTDDLTTRRIFKALHHPDVAICTNIERRTLQLLNSDLLATPGVYCARDTTGNYHAVAACVLDGTLRRTRISSSTSYGIAEKLVAALHSIQPD